MTAVPIAGQPVSYVTVWGTSETEPQTPLISTLNAPTGTVTANASLVTINRVNVLSPFQFIQATIRTWFSILPGIFTPSESLRLRGFRCTRCHPAGLLTLVNRAESSKAS